MVRNTKGVYLYLFNTFIVSIENARLKRCFFFNKLLRVCAIILYFIFGKSILIRILHKQKFLLEGSDLTMK